MANVIVGGALAVLVLLAVRRVRRKKLVGGCGCGCEGCGAGCNLKRDGGAEAG